MSKPRDLTPLVGMSAMCSAIFGTITDARGTLPPSPFAGEIMLSGREWLDARYVQVSRDGSTWMSAEDMLDRLDRGGAK